MILTIVCVCRVLERLAAVGAGRSGLLCLLVDPDPPGLPPARPGVSPADADPLQVTRAAPEPEPQRHHSPVNLVQNDLRPL